MLASLKSAEEVVCCLMERVVLLLLIGDLFSGTLG